jgi:2-keto-4-pentenoate hydratase/2-oxohepta-3-ene-1,7-dioic acid hydratase in catechol pathway
MEGMIVEYGRFIEPENGTIWQGLIDRTAGVIRAVAGTLLDPEPKVDGRVRALQGLRALPPLDPPIAVAVGLNYPEHGAETGSALPSEPWVFRVAPAALLGDQGKLVVPTAEDMDMGVTEAWLDPEPEPVAVIGYDGQVFGWAPGNDVSERRGIDAFNSRSMPFNLPGSFGKDYEYPWCKNLPGFKPLGSIFRGDIDPHNIDIEMIVNGATVQTGNTRNMIFPVEELVPHIAKLFELERLPAGAVIFCGTPPGVGYQPLHPERQRPPLKAGDTMMVKLSFSSVTTHVVAKSK